MVTRLSLFKSGLFLFVVLISSPFVFPQSGPQVMYEFSHDTSPPLREIVKPPEWGGQSPRPLFHPTRMGDLQSAAPAPSVEQAVEPLTPAIPVSANIGLNFDGVADLNGAVPPDPNASVGATQVVETVNLSFGIFNKTTGATVFGPASISSIWNGFAGNLCGQATSQYADPIVLYDKAAKRWLVTIVANSPKFASNSMCLAVSATSDARSAYHRYEISYGSDFVDYPKFGVWPDGYYMSILVFTIPPPNPLFLGPRVCALNRTAMLAGQTLSLECFQRASGDFVFLPSDLDSAQLPPKGEPNFFVEIFPTVNPSTVMLLFKFHADFSNPTNATFTGPVRISVKSFHEACADGFTCIPQGGTSQQLDALGDRLMHRMAYRNFSDHEVLLATHAVVGASSAAAMQWCEIRNPNATPAVFQQGVFSPGGTTSAWMGSIAMDKVGDIALGFSTSSSTLKPGIRFTGRIPSDTSGTMEAAKTIKQGTGSETDPTTDGRWGDYTSMSIDPVDGCTFWYTNEYFTTDGKSWRTRLASFKFTQCK
jgi:hypothetical protein